LQAFSKAKVLSSSNRIASTGEASVSNEAKLASPKARIASSGKANASKALGEAISQVFHKANAPSSDDKAASLDEASAYDEANLASAKAGQTAFTKQKSATKAKSNSPQPKGVIFQLSRVSVLDRLGLANSNLRDYLSNK